MQEDWIIIANRLAGKGQIGNQRARALDGLKLHKLPFILEQTNSLEETERLVLGHLIDGAKKFLVLGGDGSVNGLLNILMKQNVEAPNQLIMAAIPLGSGNDWVRTHGFFGKMEENIGIIANSIIKPHDVGKIVIDKAGQSIVHYFINMVGGAFDPRVVERHNELSPGIRRKPGSYMLALLLTFIKYQGERIILEIDGNRKTSNLFNLNVAIGKFAGGGMLLAPTARYDDGRFEIISVKSLSKWKIIRNLVKVYRGNHLQNSEITVASGKKLMVEYENEGLLESDGELLPPAHRFEITIMPKAIKVISNK
ncbi:MAG: diacylglycerol kinase family protein [Bacteroidetes bacterium]|nr:diacylglycerol kinase family protein [Bacteroidota bacterium]